MTFRIPRKKTYPYSDTPMKNHQKFCRRAALPGSSQGPPLASVAERLQHSARNPKVPGSSPGADLFFFFWVSPGPPQGFLKASPGPSRVSSGPSFIALSTARAAARGSNKGPPRLGRTLVRPPAAAPAVDNALTHYHTNVWL